MQKQKQDENKESSIASEQPEHVFRLYITGASPNSVRAITNMKIICEEHLAGKYSLEVIDVYQMGTIAKSEQIIALPLLIRKQPLPERRLIGDLSDKSKVLKSLGLIF